MKLVIINICIWILRKFKVSVIIGMHLDVEKDGSPFLRAKNNISRWYDSDLFCIFYDPEWQKFEIPNRQKFSITRISKTEEMS